MNPYSLLSRLPLFQGMSSSEFDDVISHVRMGFSKVSANERIFAEGEPVNGLSFILYTMRNPARTLVRTDSTFFA